jgi:hypothetical protein
VGFGCDPKDISNLFQKKRQHYGVDFAFIEIARPGFALTNIADLDVSIAWSNGSKNRLRYEYSEYEVCK